MRGEMEELQKRKEVFQWRDGGKTTVERWYGDGMIKSNTRIVKER